MQPRIAPQIFHSLVSFICNDISQGSCDYYTLRMLLSHATHLEVLSILGEINNADAAFANVHIKAPLKELTIKTDSLTDASVEAICQLAESLTILQIGYQITNDGAFQLLYYLTKLTKLCVNGCSNIDNRLLGASLSIKRPLNIYCARTNVVTKTFVKTHPETEKSCSWITWLRKYTYKNLTFFYK